MDTIKARLQETAAECVKCFEAWESDTKDNTVRQSLHDAVHELRKVASRLEIEMAISERAEKSKKPLPIPTHRDRAPRAADQIGGDDGSGEARKPYSGGAKSSSGGGSRRNTTRTPKPPSGNE